MLNTSFVLCFLSYVFIVDLAFLPSEVSELLSYHTGTSRTPNPSYFLPPYTPRDPSLFAPISLLTSFIFELGLSVFSLMCLGSLVFFLEKS